MVSINVRDLGAKGDGTTNDTTAFQKAAAAINAAGGGTIYIPPGNYVVGRQNPAGGTYIGEHVLHIQDCPDPVLIFEHNALYNMEGELAVDAGAVDIDRALVRRIGKAVSLITYGGSLFKTLQAADQLASDGIDCEVIDLRSLRPLDEETILNSVRRTRRAVIVDEGWRSGSLAAEVGMRIAEQAFYDLDAAPARVCAAEVPIPYAKHLEDAALPQIESIVRAVKEVMGKNV